MAFIVVSFVSVQKLPKFILKRELLVMIGLIGDISLHVEILDWVLAPSYPATAGQLAI